MAMAAAAWPGGAWPVFGGRFPPVPSAVKRSASWAEASARSNGDIKRRRAWPVEAATCVPWSPNCAERDAVMGWAALAPAERQRRDAAGAEDVDMAAETGRPAADADFCPHPRYW
mmetsp:Transcript_77251/g.198871  ORF Transcript_77251/g.198871 Transcript_77251/m.198871 type:complete len:115 (+) Transcript_77251:59-403(+)